MFQTQINMAGFAAIFLIFCSYFGQNFADATEETLVWPTEYHIKAEKLDLKSGHSEPMELWSSAAHNMSRLDYYGGMTKEYFVWPQDEVSGYVINVFPYTTEHKENGKECTSSEEGAEGYKFLPDPDKYKYTGEKFHEGSTVRVWELRENLAGQIWKEFTIYTQKSGEGFDIPVQIVRKAFYNERGMMAGHSVTNFFQYNTDVNIDVFDTHNDGCTVSEKLGENLHTDLKFLHPSIESHVDIAFNSFKNHHKKQYTSQSEHELRKYIFQENWAFINHHNLQNLSYRLQVNRFADFTPAERARLRGTRLATGPGTHIFPHSNEEVKAMAEELPENYDMRLEGIISPIKNQGNCGSCWSFSSTAAVEGALARSNGGRILDLSEQSLVDCAWGFSNLGCHGGNLKTAYEYVLKHQIPLEEEYGEYLEQDGYCHIKNMTEKFGIKGFGMVTPLNPDALKVALHTYGPVAVTINFSDAMEFYASGVFYDATCNDGSVNHGVTVVGYGVRAGAAYWIIRNSHGDDWGEGGYMLLSAADNNCFLLGTPYYPVV